MDMGKEYWIEGKPATFATSREESWKEQIYNALQNEINNFDAIEFEFIFHKEDFEKYEFDVDNLCEPVFAVLTTSLGWYSGKRSNIAYWRASKRTGKTEGLFIREVLKNGYKAPNTSPIFEAVYQGVFPNKATDEAIPKWINQIGVYKKVNNKCILQLQFGSEKLSVATISTGKVKPIIDCLYPIIGGNAGAPKDEIIEVLVVEKQRKELENDMVRITVWE